jgi:hypothetical protein
MLTAEVLENFPDGQPKHCSAPSDDGWYEPGVQPLHSVSPAVAVNLPAAHNSHTLAAGAACARPAGQGMQLGAGEVAFDGW